MSKPMMQALVTKPEFWIGMFFLTGIVAIIISSLIVGRMWSREKRRVEAEADAAGAVIHLDSAGGIDVFAIEGCGYCIGLIVIAILGAVGISLPIVISEEAEDLIMLLILIIFGAVSWAVTIWSPFYLRNERRRFRRALEDALRRKST